jgi:hypothetical protein
MEPRTSKQMWRQVRCLDLPVIGRTRGTFSYAKLGHPAPEASS